MRNYRQPKGTPAFTFGKNDLAHVFDVKMSEITVEAQSDSGIVSVHGYPEGVWINTSGEYGLHIDTNDDDTWLEIPFSRVITWRPDNPKEVLSWDWRRFADGGGPAEMPHFFDDELTCLNRIALGLDPWPRYF